MPNSSNINSYPGYFMDFALRLNSDPTAILEIPCDDAKQAERFRFKLYGFQKAMRAAKMEKDLPEMANAEICLRGNIVTIQNRDQSWASKLAQRMVVKHPEKKE